jgi:hypothetical protein
MSLRSGVLVVLTVTLVGGLGLGGYFVGKSEAPSRGEAKQAREDAYNEAERVAEKSAFTRSRDRGEEIGLPEGRKRGSREGRDAGTHAGEADVGEQLAASEPSAEPASGSGLVYDEQLPHGRPGYILPEEERSISCIGIDAATGECVGD